MEASGILWGELADAERGVYLNTHIPDTQTPGVEQGGAPQSLSSRQGPQARMSAMAPQQPRMQCSPRSLQGFSTALQDKQAFMSPVPMSLTGGLSQHPLHPESARSTARAAALNDAQRTAVQGREAEVPVELGLDEASGVDELRDGGDGIGHHAGQDVRAVGDVVIRH